MPGVLREVLIQPPGSGLGMYESALEVRITQRFEQVDPAQVQAFQKIERCIHGQGSVGQRRPARFVVRLNGGFVFGQSELEADVRVQVAIGHMMRDLSDGPAGGTVGSFELFL